MTFALLFSVAVIATCGLVYELIAGALASYLLGDSITQFSFIIGAYLFSMGIGSYLSKFVTKKLLATFISIEFLVGIFGGLSATVLFLSFEYISSFRILLYLFVFIIGTLVGLEIPLLMRILEDKYEFKDLVSKVFTVDYIGALFASITFPLFLAPQLGLMRTALLFGMFNILVGLWTLYLFRNELHNFRLQRLAGIAAFAIMVLGFVYSNKLLHFAESNHYADPIIYNKKSPYQKLIITKGNDLKLFINGNLQFSSMDEYRYHEALIHPAMGSRTDIKKVLVLGGGDGFAIREILKYPQVESITLVDLDPLMTKIFKSNQQLVELNNGALNSSKVKIINDDAFVWMKNKNKQKFDFIVIDFPDPSNFSLGKLYSKSFFKIVKNTLSDEGLMVIQSTSPYFARKSFWCVGNTIDHVGLRTTPYHAYVPSFGEWGYFIASKTAYKIPTSFVEGLKFLNVKTLQQMFEFPIDMSKVETKVNRLNNQILVRYFEQEWSSFN
ncbi:MAG: polyamine aminopropyltransferase [Halobacteriovoraceae bacterium]|nr:polyamine aminopropyltransferase [Halobacteriovoraceae bacterium]